jgi:hypothetical protein
MGRTEDTHSGSGPDNEKFRVEPGELRKVGGLLEDLADGSPSPRAYAKTYVDFDPSGGAIMERFVDVTTGMDTGVAAMMKDIVDCVKGSGRELRRAATLYESLDAAAAARLDTSYWQH